jgi:hypothetical protein
MHSWYHHVSKFAAHLRVQVLLGKQDIAVLHFNSLHSLLFCYEGWAPRDLGTTSYWEWWWMYTGMMFRIRTCGSFSGLNGPCSDERGFLLKKSLDHTLVKITDWFILVTLHNITLIYCPQLGSHTMHCTLWYVVTMRCNTIHNRLLFLHSCCCAVRDQPFKYSRMTYCFQNLLHLDLSRTFHIVLQVENVLDVSLLLASGMRNWYITPAITGLFRVTVDLSKHSLLLILRIVTVKLSITRT